MDFFELINSRESCRSFDADKRVEHRLLEKCISAAHIAPSACNSQPWQFIVVESEDAKCKVRDAVQRDGANKFSDNAQAFICIAEQPAQLKGSVAEKFGQNYFVKYDIGIVTAHIILAARELGLSSCVMGWLDEDKLRNAFGVADDKKIPLVIALGYATDNSLHRKMRKDTKDIVRYE